MVSYYKISHHVSVILGGGLPLGSLICLHEDTHSQYNQTLLKYFLSEGLSCKHSLCVVCSNASSKKFISSLPFNNSYHKLMSQQQQEQQDAKKDEEEAKKHLKIALRYEEYVSEQIQRKKQQLSSAYTKELSKVSSRTVGTVMCHEYDLSKDVQPELLKQNEDIHGIDLLELKKENLYSSLYDEISKIIETGKRYILIHIRFNKLQCVYTTKELLSSSNSNSITWNSHCRKN
jgi:hypothetical protein